MNTLYEFIKNSKKADLLKIAKKTCKKHKHSYLSHYSCLRDELGIKERIGILDIETDDVRDLQYGLVRAYAIKEYGENKFYMARMTSKTVKNRTYDLDLIKQFLEDVQHFDKLITYCGSLHDFPSLRTRALYWSSNGYKINFPVFQMVKHFDIYFTARSKLKLRNKRLRTVCSLLNIPSKGIFTTPTMNWDAGAGCDKALNRIMLHAKEDTISTEKVHDKLCDFTGPKNNSI